MSITYCWEKMTPILANEILISTQKSDKKLYRKMIGFVAASLEKRPSLVMEMPKKERHRELQKLLAQPDFKNFSFDILRCWFVGSHTPMLSDWLRSIGAEPDEKGCTDRIPACPSSTVLETSIEALLKKYDPFIVTLYLATFNELDETNWEPLSHLLKTYPDLPLSKEKAEAL